MNSFFQQFVTVMLESHLSSLWPVLLAPLLVAALLRPALTLIEKLPAGSTRQRQMAFAASVIPGVVFWYMAWSGTRLMLPGAMHSAGCFAHCVVLVLAFSVVPCRASLRFRSQSATVAQLLRLKEPPSERLEYVASALGLCAWELPTDEPICCLARIFRPCILISRGALRLLSDEELRAALLHERAHLRIRETLWVAIGAFLNQNSLVAVPGAVNLFRSSGEYAADREAARDADPGTLASVLLRFGRFGLPQSSLVINLANGAGVVARARVLVCGDSHARIGARLLGAMCLLIFATTPGLLPLAVRMAGELWCRP